MLQNRKVFLSFAGLLLLSLFALNFVSAYRYGFVGSIDSALYQAQPVLSFFFGGEIYNTYMIFEKILIFLLILSLVFVSLKSAPLFNDDKNRKVVILVSVIVSLLSVRYINAEWLHTIITTYQVLGIALTSILPFIIYFFFLMGVAQHYPGIRKIGWILFVCVYLGLYATAETDFYGEVYLWTALVALVFLFLDGTIQRYMATQKMREAGSANIIEHIGKLNKRLDDIEASPGLTPEQKVIAKKPILKSLEYYQKQLKHF